MKLTTRFAWLIWAVLLAPFYSLAQAPLIVQAETNDDIILLGDSTQFEVLVNSPNIASYDWTPSTFLSCSDCPNPICTPTMDICYTILVTDTQGNTASDELCIYMKQCPGENILSNAIVGIAPQNISTNAVLSLEISRTQYITVKVNDGQEKTLWEGWAYKGEESITIDFSSVDSGSHTLTVEAWPLNLSTSFTKQ